MKTVEEINMALFERVIRDLITQDEFALDEEMTNLEAAAFIAEAREEIECWLVRACAVEDVTKVAASVANPAECGVCRPLSGTPCVDLVTISGAVSRSR